MGRLRKDLYPASRPAFTLCRPARLRRAL